jgi:hypothetical protein
MNGFVALMYDEKHNYPYRDYCNRGGNLPAEVVRYGLL